jgi:hypothetical protein
LYVNEFINGKSMRKVLVGGGDVVNIMAMATFRRLSKALDDLIKTNVVLRDFEGGKSKVEGS